MRFPDVSIDKRPMLGAWAPGGYIGECQECSKEYIGDKRSLECADCAYSKEVVCDEATNSRRNKRVHARKGVFHDRPSRSLPRPF